MDLKVFIATRCERDEKQQNQGNTVEEYRDIHGLIPVETPY
jgi:hypothetical protein